MNKEIKTEYWNKTIRFTEGDGGTIQVMEWIREHGCPNLSFTTFGRVYDNEEPRYGLMVSSYDDRPHTEHDLDEIKQGEWFEYKGMYRNNYCGMFVFYIDEHWYFATRL